MKVYEETRLRIMSAHCSLEATPNEMLFCLQSSCSVDNTNSAFPHDVHTIKIPSYVPNRYLID